MTLIAADRDGFINWADVIRSTGIWAVLSFFHTSLAEIISVANPELLTVTIKEPGLVSNPCVVETAPVDTEVTVDVLAMPVGEVAAAGISRLVSLDAGAGLRLRLAGNSVTL